MEILVCAECTSQIQTRHSRWGSEENYWTAWHTTAVNDRPYSKRGEAPLIISPNDNLHNSKWLTFLTNVQERSDQGIEVLQHCEMRLLLRSLEQLNVTLKQFYFMKVKSVSQKAHQNVAATGVGMTSTGSKIQSALPFPERTDAFLLERHFTFKINSI